MLTNWLSPVSDNQVSSYFTSTFSCQGNFPDLMSAKIVVFSRESSFSGAVRSELARLFNHFEVSFVDIGNLNTQNASSAYQVVSELQDGHILPILLGVDHEVFREFCTAMSKEGKLQTCGHISNRVAISTEDVNIENIGYQRHFIPKFQYQEVLHSKTPGLSLGMLRANQRILEPVLRECNYIHFDLGAIRKSDAIHTPGALPTGLTSEEACQVMRYAGEGMRLRLLSIDTSGLSEDSLNEAMLVAELLWYFHEGAEMKGQDHPAISSNFKEYIIELNDVDHSLVFTQSNASGKWWLKIENDSNKYVSCAYEEYQQTIAEEIPERLLKLL